MRDRWLQYGVVPLVTCDNSVELLQVFYLAYRHTHLFDFVPAGILQRIPFYDRFRVIAAERIVDIHRCRQFINLVASWQSDVVRDYTFFRAFEFDWVLARLFLFQQVARRVPEHSWPDQQQVSSSLRITWRLNGVLILERQVPLVQISNTRLGDLVGAQGTRKERFEILHTVRVFLSSSKEVPLPRGAVSDVSFRDFPC